MGINKCLFLVNSKVALASGFMEAFTLIYNIFGGDGLRCSKFYRVTKREYLKFHMFFFTQIDLKTKQFL